jgi:MerR family transcriptional regulator, heat shock protein HspR
MTHKDKTGAGTYQAKKRETKRSFYEPVYTIGVAAGKLNMTVHNIRLYESEGLILPYRTDTGRRLFSDLELEKIRCIRSMIKEEGLNFEGIRRLLAMVPCWKMRNCTLKERSKCPAYVDRIRPCWDIDEKCLHPLPSCRDCDVYRDLVKCEDVQALIQSIR